MITLSKFCVVLSAAFMVEMYAQENYGMALYFLGCLILNIVAVGLS